MNFFCYLVTQPNSVPGGYATSGIFKSQTIILCRVWTYVNILNLNHILLQ